MILVLLGSNVKLTSSSAVASTIESVQWSVVIPVAHDDRTGRPVLKSVEG
jgi:hypothetical protein